MIKNYINVPNSITLLRVLLIIPILLLLENNNYLWAFILTAFALATDFIDGKIARQTNTVTLAGSMLDPIADKIFVFCLFYFFTFKDMLNFSYFAISSTRDILQLLAIPILVGYKKVKFNINPKLLPKIATVFKYLIILLLFLIPFKPTCSTILLPIIILSALIEIYILGRYLIRYFEVYKGLHHTFE